MIYKKLLYTYLVFGMLSSIIYGQTIPSIQKDYIANVQHFTIKDGLSHRRVNSVTKDERGIIWVGTENGLNRFDNKTFKVFYKKDGLASSNISQTFIDGAVIWCLHNKESDNLYNTLSLFHTIEERNLSLEEHLGSPPPFQIKDIKYAFLHQRTLFFELLATKNSLKYSYTPSKGFQLLSFLQKDEFIIGQTISGFYWTIGRLEDHPIIRKIDKQGKEIQRVSLDFVKNLYDISIQYEEANGTTWFKYVKHEDSEIFSINSLNQINWMPTFSDNELYYVHPYLNARWRTSTDGMFLLNAQNESLIDIPLPIHSLKNQVLIDEFTIWQPSLNGLYQIELKKNNFTQIFADGTYEGFRSINKIGDKLFFNSYGGVYQSQVDLKAPYVKVLPSGLCGMTDQEGNLWVSNFNVLIRYNPQTQETKTYQDILAYESWSLFEDVHGRIWYSQFGLYYLDSNTGNSYPVVYNEFEELKKSTVYHFYKKEDGRLLLCSTSGLYEMDLSEGIVARYWSGGEGKYHIPADDFRYLYFDASNQSYWLATNQSGLIHWQAKDGQVAVYPLSHLASRVIHAVYADDNGFLWLSTENGIIQFHKESHKFKVYLPQNGTSTHEFNRISHFQDEQGKIYFGSINGITIFHPKDFNQQLHTQQNANIQVLQLQQYLARTNTIENLTANFYQNNRIYLHAGDRFFKIKLALDDYAHHGEAVYYYQIEDQDKQWTAATGNELSISGLPFGEQILQIKALLPNGQFLPNILKIPVFVGKPFYLKWWFFSLLILLSVAAALLFTHWRTQQLKEQQALLKEEVRKRTAQIEQQAEELRELDKTKSKFFANVSHELRTPIMLIQGPIQSVIKNQQLQPQNFTLLQTAAQNTKKLMRLVNEILVLTKLDSQKLELQETKVLFYTFLRRIISNFQSVADAKAIELVFVYQLKEVLQIQLDQAKFEKVLNNLLSNAFKFTPKNGQIKVTASRVGGDIILKVQDNGRGIPDQDIPYVFNRFYQSSSNQKAEGGLGIGLALSIEYIKLMKGKMWVESSTVAPTNGTTFFVQFPKKEIMTMLSTATKLELEGLKLEKQPKLQAPILSNVGLMTQSHSEQSHILLVEDNHDLRQYISYLLAPFYKIIMAENGQEALNRLATEPVIDLIISDIMMPIMDGYEFLEQLKKQDKYRHLPVIMLTARAESQDRLKALRIGVDDYLVKPFEEEELLARIKNLLANVKNRANFLVEKLSHHQAFTKIDALSDTATKDAKMTQADSEWLGKLETHILENIGKLDLTSEQIAQEMYVSRSKLFRKIKALTGLTLQQYIKEIRLEKARVYLEQQTYSTVKQVVYAVGLKDTRTFTKNFKQRYGKLPSAYF